MNPDDEDLRLKYQEPHHEHHLDGKYWRTWYRVVRWPTSYNPLFMKIGAAVTPFVIFAIVYYCMYVR